MNYVVIVLLFIIIALLVTLIIMMVVKDKNKDKIDINSKLNDFQLHYTHEMMDFRTNFSKDINNDINNLKDKIEERLILINEKVNSSLNENFEKTNKTFTSVIERLTRIDEAQKKIEVLSNDVVSLQEILTDKKTRGIFGEVNLRQILSSVFGESNDKVYKMQASLPNNTIADSILYAPSPLGTIVIDSKFPLESYRRMIDKDISMEERKNYEKQFKIDVKKHIDAISNKYIIEGVTGNDAIMFLPAEAIFAEINAHHSDIVDYSYKKHVFIASPTTLMSTLTVIEMIIKNIERDKYTSIIHDELKKLGLEFARYRERWDKLSKSIQSVNRDIENVNITTEKITKKFEAINQVKISEIKGENEIISDMNLIEESNYEEE